MTPAPAPSVASRLTGLFWRRPNLLLVLLLAPPLLWLGVVYLGSLAALLLQSHRLVPLPNLGAPNSHSALVHGMTAPIGSCPSWPTVIDV